MLSGLNYIKEDGVVVGCSLIGVGSEPNLLLIVDSHSEEFEINQTEGFKINHTEVFLSTPLPEEIKNELKDKPFHPWIKKNDHS